MNRWARTGIILGLITAVELGVYYHYNSLFGGNNAVSKNTTTQTAPVDQTVIHHVSLKSPNLLTVAPEGSQVAWLDPQDKLHVVNTSDGSEAYTLQINYTPIYLAFFRSGNLFIGTETTSGSTKDIRLSTIDTNSNQVRLIKDFAGYSADATLEKIGFSVYTNDTYILIGDPHASVVYHFNTNGNMYPENLGGRVLYDIAITATSAKVYVQDFASGTKNVLAFDPNSGTHLIQLAAALLGVVQNTVYYATLDTNGQATAIYKLTDNNTPQQVMTLQHPTDPKTIYVGQNNHIYVAGSSSYQDLTASKTTRVPAGATIINAGDALCVLTENGDLKFIQ